MPTRMNPDVINNKLRNMNMISDVINVIKSGKEATVYRCKAHPSLGKEYVVAKVYRPVIHRSFKNDAMYQKGRYIGDERTKRALKKKTDYGRSIKFSSWISGEFETLEMLYGMGVDVPEPYSQTDDTVFMEYIGNHESAAPILKRVHLSPSEVQPTFHQIMSNIELMLEANRIHGDLSSFNILYWDGKIKIIDFPQSVHPRHNPDAFHILMRDVKNICNDFRQYGINEEPFTISEKFWKGFLSRSTE